MVRYNVIVSGYVQGVGFRYFARLTASKYNICGWVRNKENGSVEIDAEGKEIDMNKFIEAIKNGNRFSSVEDINTNKIKEYENYRSFDIIDDDY